MYTKDFIEKMKYYHELNDHEYVFDNLYRPETLNAANYTIAIEKLYNKDLTQNELNNLDSLTTKLDKEADCWPATFYTKKTDTPSRTFDGEYEWDECYPIDDFQKDLEKYFNFNKEDRKTVREKTITSSPIKEKIMSFIEKKLDYLDGIINQEERKEQAEKIQESYFIVRDLPEKEFENFKLNDNENEIENKLKDLLDRNERYKEAYKNDYEYHMNNFDEAILEQQHKIIALKEKPTEITIHQRTGKESYDGKGFWKWYDDFKFELEKEDDIRTKIANEKNELWNLYSFGTHIQFEEKIKELNSKINEKENMHEY